eukprot:TRINITY_DN925_c0_g1_i4.p2 TRINITY_DN925_c0_g1~~TRINITY_DN925_c0_g1_i4.p2  ORF type:complete len:186 (-),score=-23.42 TRINITY_DN925_c0_g1_i4:222-779(-)
MIFIQNKLFKLFNYLFLHINMLLYIQVEMTSNLSIVVEQAYQNPKFYCSTQCFNLIHVSQIIYICQPIIHLQVHREVSDTTIVIMRQYHILTQQSVLFQILQLKKLLKVMFFFTNLRIQNAKLIKPQKLIYACNLFFKIVVCSPNSSTIIISMYLLTFIQCDIKYQFLDLIKDSSYSQLYQFDMY